MSITTALEFSGGKDSLACLHLWHERGLLPQTVVVWCNSGAAYPETIEQMARVRSWVPNFLEVHGDQPAVIERYGYPSDVVPILASPYGQWMQGGKRPAVLVQGFIDCCARAIWQPLERAIKALGVTKVVRGQRRDERLTSPIRHGHTEDGIEYLLPIQDWNADQVMSYLESVGAEVPEYYKTEPTSRDCWNCTAYRFESKERTENLRGEQREIVFARLEEIRAAIAEAGY
jgi:3'-phosphoadenosine 5'-phosphosulfate sulfotransferase (PAPS reductase)/FAD synthetase